MDVKTEMMRCEADLTQIVHFIYRAHILMSKANEETVIFPWEQENPTETMQTQQQRVLLETADEDLSMANDLAKDLFDKFETLVEALNDTAESIKEI